jgi:WD40 repeat protein
LLTLRGQAGNIGRAVFSPDGQRILTAGEELFHPDSTQDFTASEAKTARVWNAVSGQPLITLQGHTGYVESAEFSPDGQRIVTASEDKTSRVFRVVTLSEIAELLSK